MSTKYMKSNEIQMYLNQRSETELRVILNMVLNDQSGKYTLQRVIEKYKSVVAPNIKDSNTEVQNVLCNSN